MLLVLPFFFIFCFFKATVSGKKMSHRQKVTVLARKTGYRKQVIEKSQFIKIPLTIQFLEVVKQNM